MNIQIYTVVFNNNHNKKRISTTVEFKIVNGETVTKRFTGKNYGEIMLTNLLIFLQKFATVLFTEPNNTITWFTQHKGDADKVGKKLQDIVCLCLAYKDVPTIDVVKQIVSRHSHYTTRPNDELYVLVAWQIWQMWNQEHNVRFNWSNKGGAHTWNMFKSLRKMPPSIII